MRIIVTSSTYPATPEDKVPRFVHDQVHALADAYPELKLWVNAPHTAASRSASLEQTEQITEHRFHYFWPPSLEKLAGGGIMPNILKAPWLIIEVPFLFIFSITSLLRLTKSVKPDYIYAHWFTPQGIAASIVSRITGVPYVLTTHASDVAVWHKIPVLGKWVVHSFIKNAQAITAVSSRTSQKLQSFYSDQQWTEVEPRLEIIPMGIDFQQLSSGSGQSQDALKSKHDLSDKLVLFFIGRLTEKKGLHYLLPSIAELKQRGINLQLIIAGDGELRADLEQQTEKLDITDSVDFVGYVGGEHKQELFDLSDIIMVPSIVTASGDAEGLPVSLMEGMAAGKLCIATDVSGADDIMTDGEHGLIVTSRDSDQLTSAIMKLTELSPAEADQIRSNAKSLARGLDWSQIAKRHYQFFDESLS